MVEKIWFGDQHITKQHETMNGVFRVFLLANKDWAEPFEVNIVS